MPKVPDSEKKCGETITFDCSAWPANIEARGASSLRLTCDQSKHPGSLWHGATVTLLDNDRDVDVSVTIVWRSPDARAQTASEIADVLVATGQG